MIPLLLLIQAAEISPENLEKHVRRLAADDLRGRDNATPESLRAADYIAEAMKAAGLAPGAKDGWFHDFHVRGVRGRNVAGLRRGERADEIVVVGAHYDAHGVIKGKIQNGADDNASGVAVVLELARVLAAGPKPERSILFIAFDAEEDGLIGSRAFVKDALYPPTAFTTAVVFDLVGGDFLPWETDRAYAFGSASSEALDRAVARAEVDGLEVTRLGAYLLEPLPGLARSDYAPFRDREVPFVFFSTGTPWYYHTEHDDPGVINWAKLLRVARFARQVVAAVASGPRPVFRRAASRAGDAEAIGAALDRVLARREDLRDREGALDAAAKLRWEILAAAEPDPRLLQKAMNVLLTIARAQGRQE